MHALFSGCPIHRTPLIHSSCLSFCVPLLPHTSAGALPAGAPNWLRFLAGEPVSPWQDGEAWSHDEQAAIEARRANPPLRPTHSFPRPHTLLPTRMSPRKAYR